MHTGMCSRCFYFYFSPLFVLERLHPTVEQNISNCHKQFFVSLSVCVDSNNGEQVIPKVLKIPFDNSLDPHHHRLIISTTQCSFTLWILSKVVLRLSLVSWSFLLAVLNTHTGEKKTSSHILLHESDCEGRLPGLPQCVLSYCRISIWLSRTSRSSEKCFSRSSCLQRNATSSFHKCQQQIQSWRKKWQVFMMTFLYVCVFIPLLLMSHRKVFLSLFPASSSLTISFPSSGRIQGETPQRKKTNSAKRRRCVGVESRPVCGVTPGYPVSAPKSAECSLHCLLPSVGSLDRNQGLTHEFM